MLYGIVLYVHVLTAVGLASAFAFEMLSLSRMRAAKSVSDARLWVDLGAKLPAVVGVSGLVLLFSGGYLTGRMGAWAAAWPKEALGALLLMAPLGALSGRRMRAIRTMLLSETNGLSIVEALSDRFLTLSLSLRLWILAGVLWLMTAMPSGTASLLIISISIAIGCLFAVFGSRRRVNLKVLDASASSRS
jgi:hypothetical protein